MRRPKGPHRKRPPQVKGRVVHIGGTAVAAGSGFEFASLVTECPLRYDSPRETITELGFANSASGRGALCHAGYRGRCTHGHRDKDP